jgi:hypothetical protein
MDFYIHRQILSNSERLNELTAKLSCIDNNNNDDAAKVTKWQCHVVGVSSYGN